jgi:hypothetical protein
MFQIRVILFMQCKPGYYGVNGSLRFASSNLMEVGDYLKKQSSELSHGDIAREESIAEEFERENTPEEVLAIETQVTVVEPNEQPIVNDEEADDESIDEEASWLDPAQRLSLKNKELEVVDVI